MVTTLSLLASSPPGGSAAPHQVLGQLGSGMGLSSSPQRATLEWGYGTGTLLGARPPRASASWGQGGPDSEPRGGRFCPPLTLHPSLGLSFPFFKLRGLDSGPQTTSSTSHGPLCP